MSDPVWTVVLTYRGQSLSQTTFKNRSAADDFAHKLIREQRGCQVHIEYAGQVGWMGDIGGTPYGPYDP